MTSSPLPYAALLPLEGVVRDYAWGSATAIPQLLGRPPTGAPVAELWLGAHPRRTSHDRRHPTRPRLGHRRRPRATARAGDSRAVRAAAALPAQGDRAGQQHCRSRFIRRASKPRPASRPKKHEASRAAIRAATTRTPTTSPRLVCALTAFEASVRLPPDVPHVAVARGTGCAGVGAVRGECWPQPTGSGAPLRCLLDQEPDRARAIVDALTRGCERLAAVGGEWSDNATRSSPWLTSSRTTSASLLSLLLHYVRLAPREVDLPGTRYGARLPGRPRGRGHGQQRQRAALRPHAQARRCARTARGHEFQRDAASGARGRTSSTKSPGTTRRCPNSSYPSMSFQN